MRSRSRSRSPVRAHYNVGPAESALGFPCEVIDAHAYVLHEFDAPIGLDRATKLQRLQAELGTHHTFTMRTAPTTRYVDNSSLVDPGTLALRPVEWSRDDLGRPCWAQGDERFVKGNCPPHVQTRGNAYGPADLVAAMDFASVQLAVLHTYPTFGDLSLLHRQACQQYPERYRRLVTFDLTAAPADLPGLLARVDAELAFGGVAGVQFFTGWFAGDWDGAAMRPFWDHLAAKRCAVWFTCVLGHPEQFTSSAERLFVADYAKIAAWCGRYPETDVVLTHGLPWRSYLSADQASLTRLPAELLKVFACPRVHVQLLIPLRLGDVFDFPFAQCNAMLAQLAAAVGADRLLYGTDMPMLERYCTYSQSVLHIARYCAFLSPAERALVLGGNARRLLRRADAASAQPAPGSYRLPAAVRAFRPAAVGQPLASVETPCLCVDLDAFEANCRLMNGVLDALDGVVLRPHAKCHKSSALALKQLAAHGGRAAGVCCQTVREAEAMVLGGVADVMLTNLVACPAKAQRMAQLSATAQVAVCVDSLATLAPYEAAGGALGVMIELGVACRTGVEPEATASTVALARRVAAAPNLRLRGLQVYLGTAQHMRSKAERRSAVELAAATSRAHLAALEVAGVDTAGLIVSGGGTGTLPLEAETGLYKELQCGSYIFHDVDYSLNQERHAWQQSLFVLGTVLGSYERAGLAGGAHAVVDVGLKTVAFDSGPPAAAAPGGAPLAYVNLGDEHGAVRPALPVGTRLRFSPGHCDPTVNLHDCLVGVRKDKVVEILAVDGRGY